MSSNPALPSLTSTGHDLAVRHVNAPETTRRLAAVCAVAVKAGTIASSNGSAILALMPRRNVRRGSEVFEMIISLSIGFNRI